MKTTTTILCFDQTFEGYLSAVYTAMSEKLGEIDLRPVMDKSTLLFQEVRHIPADRQKARRIWDALCKKGSSDLRLVYFSFLSENEQLLVPIYEYILLLFRAEHPDSPKLLQALRSKLGPWAQRVEREKSKLEASLHSQSRSGEFGCFRLRPVYDVLPLLTRYCRLHFGSVPWMLIDTKRRYGLRKIGDGVERFPLSVELFSSGNKAADIDWEHSKDGLTLKEAHPLQTAV
jgi:probable DNA metabolism protein